jgi:hypothetical protein
MKALAGFILQGWAAALLVITPLALLPMLQWLSAAALALVTLRRGPGEGVFLAGLATATLAAAALLAGAPLVFALAPTLSVWLPALVGGTVLRLTVSWSHALQALSALFVVAMLAFHGVVGDATAYWMNVLEPVEEELATQVDDEQGLGRAMEATAAYMTGGAFASMLALALLGLILARYWQALLFNPGGFQAEFHSLRLPRGFAAATLVAVLGGYIMGPGVVNDAGTVMITVFVLQALAVIHTLAWHRGWRSHWLVLVYVLLPLVARPLAFIGLGDVFLDLRQRLIGPNDPAA